MTKNLKFFLAAFVLSLPFWWVFNFSQEKLEDFLFWHKMAKDPNLLLAQAAQEENLIRQKPVRNKQVEEPYFQAESVISVFVADDGSQKVLFEKEGKKPLPIASITKLMTAFVVLEYYDVGPQEAAQLLYPMLIASDNETALTLAKVVSEDAFVDLMNFEAKDSGLENTFFVNPTGLDSDKKAGPFNYSTGRDLVKLANRITEKHPVIWEISILPAFEDKVNTNELLSEFPGIIGGKTGKTDMAKECLILVLRSPNQRGRLINVILGTEDRFGQMRQLIDWINSAYYW